MSIKIIAEAGVNHNGDLNLAKKMILAAKKAGADYIKFQTFISEKLVSSTAKKAEYQINVENAEENQLGMLKRLELSFQEFIQLQKECEKVGIKFLSTPFDLESLDFLEGLNMDFWKVPSGEITNLPYLKEIGKTKRPVVMSTGMATLEEIEEAIVLLEKYGTPQITLLHCTTEYPAQLEGVNLRAMDTLKETFQKEVGYSDHTEGIEISLGAAARGATIIEKHFTLDKEMEGPDHKASLDPSQLEALVTGIRKLEVALGSGIKAPTATEEQNRIAARKSIVAKTCILEGEIFTEENITVKRPGNGISPMKWEEVLGTKASQRFEKDELIQL